MGGLVRLGLPVVGPVLVVLVPRSADQLDESSGGIQHPVLELGVHLLVADGDVAVLSGHGIGARSGIEAQGGIDGALREVDLLLVVVVIVLVFVVLFVVQQVGVVQLNVAILDGLEKVRRQARTLLIGRGIVGVTCQLKVGGVRSYSRHSCWCQMTMLPSGIRSGWRDKCLRQMGAPKRGNEAPERRTTMCWHSMLD